ncbi:PD-(D/E)XK nuclease family protein [Polaromonas sp. C04]|uniref:PD-(D/E)XK nuclease family protein n=1 Tax=Polaromonas sp. C04 TaxID=1945857 RepID=UPI0009872C4E|nr:PD-(D/E)XK nuclease family protein [Polaromonas sp. C04]OOG51768.1 exonuclease [Polaromonas sp. C04]
MNVIAKSHESALAPGHPVRALWLDPQDGLIARIAAAIEHCMAQPALHPVQTVVLLPYAQLMPLAQKLWSQVMQGGFAPRFETTRNWARSMTGFMPGPDDITFDAARDGLTAQTLLERAGLGAQRDGLAGRLVESAQQLAALVAAIAPAQRPAWVARARAVVASGLDAPVLALEAAVARVALEWAAASSYATDTLFEATAVDAAGGTGLDCLIVLEGFQAEPLAQALQAQRGDKAASIALPTHAARGSIVLHAARDLEDEAQRAAACVLRHIEAGRTPVALAATDRVLTRRVRAMLDTQGITIRDENGWTLSTTRAAAHVMGALRACRWDASSDAVLDWLKNAPAFAQSQVLLLEKSLRRAGVQAWRAWNAPDPTANTAQPGIAALTALTLEVNRLLQTVQRPRPLVQWLEGLRVLLHASGQWALLAGDAAGDKLLAVLRLSPAEQGAFEQSLAPTVWATRRLDLAEFTAWVNEALEADKFVPSHTSLAGDEQVVILPMSQLLARPFAAVVLPGCDEVRLAVSPEPPGPWTAAQRAALALPTREALALAVRAAWRDALQTPHGDVLWRHSDDTGEPLLPSPLVQELLLEGLAPTAMDPREHRAVPSQPAPRPQPVAPSLPVQRLSASAYEDLRRCPYRFFALRQLGLKEADELEGEVDKRDFGLWLHAVLKTFHEALKAAPAHDLPALVAMINVAAEEITEAMHLGEDEFLPFAAAWPQVRDGYLAWLAGHEASGARFEQAEAWQEQPLGVLTLIGQIDRIDQDADDAVLLIDYKTEALAKTRERVRQPTEDTQLAFYAALQPHDTLRAAYLNVGEKGATTAVEQPAVVEVRDALIAGILHDMARIGEGAALPALGEGSACDFCAARGLCRKDFWDAA